MTGDQARAALDQALRTEMAAFVMWQHADEWAACARGGMRATAQLRLSAATRVKERASGAVQAAMNDANHAGVTDAEIVTMVSDLYQLEADDLSPASGTARASATQAAGPPQARSGRSRETGKACEL
jgi:hypothetical protein